MPCRITSNSYRANHVYNNFFANKITVHTIMQVQSCNAK